MFLLRIPIGSDVQAHADLLTAVDAANLWGEWSGHTFVIRTGDFDRLADFAMRHGIANLIECPTLAGVA